MNKEFWEKQIKEAEEEIERQKEKIAVATKYLQKDK